MIFLYFIYFMLRPIYDDATILVTFRAFWQYPKWGVRLDKVAQASDTLQLALSEFQYVLDYKVINTNIPYKELILMFLLHFSVALA
jgi:hypothetical protein